MVTEAGSSEEIFVSPKHPYTQALFSATPIADPKRRRERIRLSGEPPSPLAPPPGCAFAPRCPCVQDKCRQDEPGLEKLDQVEVACFYPVS
ncbi:MAG: hypothetical protein GY896_20450 [Gammaproteobacteria bacterium]|nr:hypothetical protein [Gammaproteobacteria bacterium]